MIKNIIKYGSIVAIGYGIFKLVELWPTETIIAIGVMAVALVIYWLIKLEEDTI
jgi:hypothetical protein